MDYSMWPSWVVVVAAVVVTMAAAVTDFRCRRIPNALTLTAFALGLLFRLSTDGLSGLLDAGAAFAVGFGTLFVLWISGGGGAGDVKLMGALSVWIGFSLTLAVLILSVVLVCLLTLAAPLFPRRSTIVASTARPGDVAQAGGSEDAGTPAAVDHESDSAADSGAADSGETCENSTSAVVADRPAARAAGTQQRMTVAFAIPLALATWIVLALDVFGINVSL